jgi:hypothetical protein
MLAMVGACTNRKKGARTMTIEETIRNYEESERINRELAKNCESALAKNHNLDNAEKCRQMIAWLRELQERRKEPEVVFCKDCRKHNVKVGFDENFHTVWKEDACPLVDWRGKAKGHEFVSVLCFCGKENRWNINKLSKN